MRNAITSPTLNSRPRAASMRSIASRMRCERLQQADADVAVVGVAEQRAGEDQHARLAQQPLAELGRGQAGSRDTLV